MSQESPKPKRQRIVFTFDNAMVTLATIVVIWLAYLIPQNFDFLDPVGKALGDVDLTDMVFSQFRNDQRSTVDTSIVLVNIGHASRGEIATILDRINEHNPAAVGLDVFFYNPKDPYEDSLLAASLQRTQNLVMVSRVDYKSSIAGEAIDDDAGAFDTLVTSNPMFQQQHATGFANLVIDQQAAFMTCREISLYDSCAGRLEQSFALKLASVARPERAAKAMTRNNELETINYHGNVESFYFINLDQALDPTVSLELVRGKVVLLGFVGDNESDATTEDKFFTPMNKHYVGRAFPDMHGVVIHANILSMILADNYINTMPFWLSIAVGLFILCCNVVLFTWVYEHIENWYDVIAVVAQLSQSIGMLFLIVLVFDKFQYKLALTPAIAAVFVVGTAHDLYQDSLKKIILSLYGRLKQRRNSATSHS